MGSSLEYWSPLKEIYGFNSWVVYYMQQFLNSDSHSVPSQLIPINPSHNPIKEYFYVVKNRE